MHRLFAGLSIPDEIAERLIPLQRDVPGAKWRRREHFHITLHFYGTISRELADEVADALELIHSAPLELQLGGAGWFGRREPSALYARIAPNAALEALSSQAKKIAKRLRIPSEPRPYIPHVTLAYCNDTPLSEAQKWSEAYQTLTSETFFADKFHLYESFTAPHRQSQYEKQVTYQL